MDDDGYFGEEIAARYDESSAEMFDPAVLDPAVAFLAQRAGAGPALELAVGTGRVALPLVQRGVEVHGVDLSRAMVARLRAKPGGADLSVTIGDIATTRVEGQFRLVYIVWNSLMNLTTQAAQVSCFRNAAAHLEAGGCFVVEVQLPDLQRLPPGEVIRPFRVTESRLGFDEYDIANQGLISHHFRFENGRVHRDSTPFRYAWPAELDLMAELAGMRPVERWGGWNHEPFTSDSRTLIGVWERSAT